MITTTLKELLAANIIKLDEEDPGYFDSYVIVDGYSAMGELEDSCWGEFVVIQRELDGDNPDHLIMVDSHGNSTYVKSNEIDIRLYKEVESLDGAIQ